LHQGDPTASGSYAYADFVPDEDDVVVERIKAAGAIVIGKTQVPEFGYSGTGQTPLAEPTCNPWNVERTSGGESAGSGAAVATGVGPFSLGSDGGGSVRIPASFCGLYGIKPTMGRVPLYPGTKDERYPGVSGWESIEHVGPLTRTVADAALVLSVIAGYDDRDRLSIRCDDVDWLRAVDGDLRGVRVAYSPDLGYAAVDPAVRSVVLMNQSLPPAMPRAIVPIVAGSHNAPRAGLVVGLGARSSACELWFWVGSGGSSLLVDHSAPMSTWIRRPMCSPRTSTWITNQGDPGCGPMPRGSGSPS
jgi:Asp-tRNA(Asn)/Glu-tRNA(Gln) amidotransferase A subunit family amidase